MEFNDKVVWITGASSGIGEALAKSLRREGAKVVVSSNEEDELDRVAGEMGGGPDRVMALPLDLSDTDEMEGKTALVLDRFGRIDILVNNGGISQRSLVKDTDMTVYRRIMEIDFFGHVALTKAVLPSMLKRRSGHIVVTSSGAGKIGTPLRSGYAAAKHALHGFFDSLRAEVWRDNIGVTIICPTAVKTNISKNAVVGDGGRYGRMDDLMEKGHSPEDIARTIISAIRKNREEVVAGIDEVRLAILLKRFAPGLLSRIVRNTKVT